ncbi:MAG TPA: hypothetical protein VN800_03875 [Candidatus Acidoferrales bacterium]|nr:hypothetical protein [Candidatus Acidoferrales bacterium]
MPLEFLKRRKQPEAAPAPPAAVPEDIEPEEFEVRLQYRAKSTEGVRMQDGQAAMRELPGMLAGVARSDIDLLFPLPVELSDAAPTIVQPSEALQWVTAHQGDSPIARHALLVLETVGAVDLAFDTLAVALLHGETDTSGNPEYNAIVGGVASHWDEATGDMLVRAVVGWGGKGVRGDTDRTAQKILSNLLANVLASQYALGMTHSERPVPAAGAGGLVCASCGFASAHERAFYCPKCGMRLLRG